MAWHSPEESPFGRSGPDHLHPLSSFQRDPAAGKKGESILAGAVKAAGKVAQQPDGWLAKRQLWSTGALISQPLIPNTSVAAWVLATPLWLNPEFSYSSHKKNKEKKKKTASIWQIYVKLCKRVFKTIYVNGFCLWYFKQTHVPMSDEISTSLPQWGYCLAASLLLVQQRWSQPPRCAAEQGSG